MKTGYKRIYLTAASTLLGLFVILNSIGLQINDVSGDFSCNGTLSDPCMSKINIINPTSKNIYVYNKNDVHLNFSPNIKDYAFFVKDGRCSGKLTGSSCSCYLTDNTEIAYKGWRCLDFTNRTKPSKNRLYMYKWPAYSSKEHLLVGFKNNPADNIKWGFGTDNKYLDPIWFGVKSNNYTVKQGDWLNETRSKIVNINGTKSIEMYDYSELIDDGNIYINGINYSIDGFYCNFKKNNLWIECDSKYDGDGNGICQRTGGETCIIYNLGAQSNILEQEFNFTNLKSNYEDEIGVVKYE